MFARCHVSLLLPLAWTRAAALETSTECEDGSRSAVDDAALMQLRVGPLPIAAPAEPVPIGATPNQRAGVCAVNGTSFQNTSLLGHTCFGNECCTFYTQTFPCPGAEDGYDLCSHKEPGQSVEAPVVFPPKADFRRQLGVEEIQGLLEKNGVKPEDFSIISNQSRPEWSEAFHPTLPGTSYYNTAGGQYPSIWGDLGQTFKPFGGLSTYIVAKVNASTSSPQTLWRMNPAQKEPQYNCGIWWGFTKTYQTSLLEASRNVATCWAYNTVTTCTLTKPFVTILGQGNAQGRFNLLSRGCAQLTTACSEDRLAPNCSSSGNLQYKGTNSVAHELLKDADFKPRDDILQVVVPGCQLWADGGAECHACHLGDAPQNIQNLTKYVEDKVKKGECDSIKGPFSDSLAEVSGLDTLEKAHR